MCIHFFNRIFISIKKKLIPEYDREPNQRLNERIFHDDVNVTSPLLGDLIVSFRWRPIIESGMINDIRASYSQEPDFILIGMIIKERCW